MIRFGHNLETTVRASLAFAIRSKSHGVLRMLCLGTVGLLSVASAWSQTFEGVRLQ